jgi:hypothetical protein
MERSTGPRAGKVSSVGELLSRHAGGFDRRQEQATARDIAQPSDVGPVAANEVERLFEETNILQIEGRLFCFDPREAKRRNGKIVLGDPSSEHQVTIEVHPTYGQPSVLAYRVLQGIFRKLTEEGLPASDTVSFTRRELAQLAGRQSFGGKQSQEIFHALMQLHRTGISASFMEKSADGNPSARRWIRLDFLVITKLLTSGKGSELSECVMQLEPKIVESLNLRHWTCFNWQRLQGFEPIGMAIYKRLYRHFSNLYQPGRTAARDLRFEKDYVAILAEWLGGLNAERYSSKVKQQLGEHLDALVRSGLIRKWTVSKKAAGLGLKMTFWPGAGFFEDYDRFYRDGQPTLRFGRAADRRAIQEPHELAAYFHDRRGHATPRLHTKEVMFASHLLERYAYDDIRGLIDYSLRRAGETQFDMRYLTAIKQYVPDWQRDHAHRNVPEAAIAA